MIEHGYARCRDGQIHYRRAGSRGGPPLVLFHQTASSGAMWEAVIARLAATVDCIALDTPGFGGSYQPEAIPDLGFCAERLLEALDDIGFDRFHACGHHTGGCIALELPPLAPGRLLSLGLIGPVLVNEAERAEYRKIFVRPFAVEASGAFLQTAWDYLRLIGAGATIDLHLREMIDHLIAHRTMPMSFTAVWDQNVETLLRGVDVPLLLMCAADDVLWPLFERACARRPDATRVVVAGADYEPDRDPDGVAAAIAAFLAGVPAARRR